MKRYIVDILALIIGAILFAVVVPNRAQAAEVEVGIGVTKYHQMPNTYWYQEEYPYKFDMVQPSLALGIKQKVWGPALGFKQFNARIGYEYLGRVTTTAQASASDANYYGMRAGIETIWPMSTWNGKGDTHGLYFAAQPEIDMGSWSLTAEAGGWIYQARWEVDIPDWRACRDCQPHFVHVAHKARWQYGPLIGAGLRSGLWSLNWTMRKAEASGDEFPAAYDSWQHNVSLRWAF